MPLHSMSILVSCEVNMGNPDWTRFFLLGERASRIRIGTRAPRNTPVRKHRLQMPPCEQFEPLPALRFAREALDSRERPKPL